MSNKGTETIRVLIDEINSENQKERFLRDFASELIDSGYLKRIIHHAISLTTYNEDSELCQTLDVLGLDEITYNLATNEWYLKHFLTSSDYPDGVLQTECGIDLEELTHQIIEMS